MPDFTTVLTERLELRRVRQADLRELYAITSDPRTWEYEPSGRHRSLSTTRAWIGRAADRWESDGLSYWILRLRPTAEDPEHLDAPAGKVVGVGGVQRKADRSWNLFYRLARDEWGHGYATEMARAAIDAAHTADPEAPVAAWILDHNLESRRVAVRLGLLDQGLHPDPGDGVLRRAYADRPLLAPPET